MRRYIIALAVVMLLGGILAALGATWSGEPADPVVFVAPYQGDKAAAVSFTFDDGLPCHRQIAAPMLADYGFRGTFYIIAGMARERKGDPIEADPRLKYGEGALSWEEIRQIAALGHEIGNHSYSHLFLPRIAGEALLRHEVQDAAALIEEEIGQRPTTFACPYNEMSPRVRQEILRTHEAIREPWTDWGGRAFTGATGQALIDKAIAQRAWLVPMIHGIDGGFLPLASDVLRQNLEYLQQRQDVVWVDTFARVSRYVRARQAARLQVTAKHGTEARFVLSSEAASVEVPLTVVVLADDDEVTDVRAARNGEALPVRVEGSRILVEVRPGPGEVQVTWE